MRFLLLLLLLPALANSLCMPEEGFVPQTKEGKINLGYANWLSAKMNVLILQVLLQERLGYKNVQLVEVLPSETFEAMRNDLVHANPEVWSVTDHVQEQLKDTSIAHAGELGIIGRIGIYLPEYAVKANPELGNWRALRIPENTKIFSKSYGGEAYNGTSGEKVIKAFEQLEASSSPFNMSSQEAVELERLLENLRPVANSTSGDSSSRGIIYSPSAAAGWGTREKDYVEQLGLHMEVVEVEEPAEDTLISIISSNYSERLPFVSYFWTPHQIHDPRSGIVLTRLQMVDADDHCRSQPDRAPCYYAEDPLVSIISQKLKDEYPTVFAFIKNFQYRSNDDQNSMLADVAYDNLTPEEAACRWINNNIDYVNTLLPEPVEDLYMRYSNSSSKVIVIFASLFILVTLVIMAIINFYRNDVVIKAASVTFCNVILFGSLFAYASVFMFIGFPSKAKCILQPVLLCTGYVLMYCSMVLKNYRIWRIFTNPFDSKLTKISNFRLALVESGVLLVELILMIIWFLTEAPHPVSQLVDSNKVRYTCGNENTGVQNGISWALFSLNCILVLGGVILSFLTRKVFSEFNESKFIAFAIYNVTILGLVVIPLVVIPEVATPEAKFAILEFGIILSTAFTVLALFLPKVIFIYFPHLGPTRTAASHPKSGSGGGVGSQRAHEVEVTMKEVTKEVSIH